MELYKRAKTKNYFEIFIFILLCLSVLYLIFQILISTGFAIDGGVISDNKGEQITSGSDVIYLGSFEEKTETTKIFLPRNVESGIYEFFVQVSYGSYSVSSHRTIELEVGEGVARLGPSEEPAISVPLIIVIILLLFLISAGRLQRQRRQRRTSELGGLIKSFEKNIGQNIFHTASEKAKPIQQRKLLRKLGRRTSKEKQSRNLLKKREKLQMKKRKSKPMMSIMNLFSNLDFTVFY